MSRSLFLSAALWTLQATAQVAAPYTDDVSGIKFLGIQHSSGFRTGIAIPENPTTDFIGQIVAPAGGWGSFSLGGSMRNNLLVTAWPNGEEIVSSFRKATGYTSPPVVTGDFTLSTIPSGTYINDTAYSYTFLCSNCLGTADEGKLALTDASANSVVAWALSTDPVTTPASDSSVLSYHAAGFGLFGVTAADAASAEFETWAATAVAGTAPGNSTTPIGGGGSTNGTVGGNTTATISNSTYDYIVAGGGIAGIVAAQRLAESGASVLLLERGGASLASTGNTDTLAWNSSVTMYDVPGFAYYLSTVGKPAFCTDTADQAGCLLGGGSMVNALMFVPPQDRDFDDKWPQGWKSADVASAASRVWALNPGQTYGSEDGTRYNNEAYEVLSQFFGSNGFTHTDAIEKPNEKVDVYSFPPWNIIDGLRAGPVRTYLPLAQAMSNFKLQLNTQVLRAVREGSAVTGVETLDSTGKRVIYNVKAGGKVILAAGSLSTPRILYNSGIGPAEQLQTVASGNTGISLPAQADWIELPVGTEIKDHVIFTLKFNTKGSLPALASTKFTQPDLTTADLFAQGSGLLAQSGQRLNFWTSVNTTSGEEVFIQGTCNGPANNTVQMKVYLTHGLTSTGSLGITADGATELTSDPWMKTDTDKEAITTFFDRLLEMTRQPNSTLSLQGTNGNVTGADLISSFVTASHYVGSAKMGTKGEAGVVVDTDTKVYGTDNLFVVDASMHPDLPTGNTQAIVMVAAEAAAARILALGTSSANETGIAQPNGTGAPAPLPIGTGSPAPGFTEVPTGAIPTASPTSLPAPSQETQRPGRGGENRPERPNRPNRGAKGRQSSTTLVTPTPTPTSVRGSYGGSYRRNAAARVPVSPNTFDDEATVWERSQKERASYLDYAY
ncbi:hypothetical protein B0J11DRAFT_70410 [Dendryphion nanum]|uniref:Glucose-methanol-choline oxidoreductase N-terminal domain-containing protein n=1 Tax=Dendryphion nanum TaxID=256645 RepID=A0A9P9DIC7_9PLEO|nr:hypothetical protein B0J11DRAFT_70410 [Dendryphion nanum]